MKAIIHLLAISILLVSCQKEQDNIPDPVIPAAKYMSLTAGSTWNFELTDNITAPATSTFTLSSTSRDSVINSKPYHVFTNSSGSTNEYYNITGNDYYNFRKLPEALGGTTVEYLYLKDNLEATKSWSQAFPVTFSGITLNATLTNTITAKGITKIIKGITYNNVIHVTTTVSIVGVPASALTTDIQSFYAEKFGLIQSVNKIQVDFAGITDDTEQQTELVTADIK
ncbi:MAG: hypothetical protein WKI04_10095 [Ferruginibacter sp.]